MPSIQYTWCFILFCILLLFPIQGCRTQKDKEEEMLTKAYTSPMEFKKGIVSIAQQMAAVDEYRKREDFKFDEYQKQKVKLYEAMSEFGWHFERKKHFLSPENVKEVEKKFQLLWDQFKELP